MIPASPPPARPTPVVLRDVRADQRYTGKPITMNLRDADLADVLKTFAELTGLNFVAYPEVRGTVTVSLKDVPWDQALELILRTNGYGSIRSGRIVLIGPAKRLAE